MGEYVFATAAVKINDSTAKHLILAREKYLLVVIPVISGLTKFTTYKMSRKGLNHQPQGRYSNLLLEQNHSTLTKA